MYEKKISVIVPIYMVEKYLNRCIKSIVDQTYKNIEIILVDDGSLDLCPKICDEWAKKDDRIKVIHKENGGLSDARNAGLLVATGDYISFIDSDDWIDQDMYTKMIDLFDAYDADIVKCAYEKTSKNINTVIQPKLEVYKLDAIEFQKGLYDGTSKSDIVVWNKIYKKELFDNLKFPVGKIHEDQFLIPKITLKCKNIVCTNQKYYYYYQSDNSIMRSAFNKNRLDALLSFEETRKIYLENNLLVLVELLDASYSFLLIKYYNLSFTYLNNRSISKKIKKHFNSRIKIYMNNHYLNYKQKIILILFYINPRLYLLLNIKK